MTWFEFLKILVFFSSGYFLGRLVELLHYRKNIDKIVFDRMNKLRYVFDRNLKESLRQQIEDGSCPIIDDWRRFQEIKKQVDLELKDKKNNESANGKKE